MTRDRMGWDEIAFNPAIRRKGTVNQLNNIFLKEKYVLSYTGCLVFNVTSSFYVLEYIKHDIFQPWEILP